MSNNKPLGIEQVANLLAPFIGRVVSKQTMTTWIRDGYFPHAQKNQPTKINSRWVIPLSDVLQYCVSFYPHGPLYPVPAGYEELFAALMAQAPQ